MVGSSGEMLMETRSTVETVSVVVCEIEPYDAPIVVLPGAMLLTTPVLSIVATLMLEELQSTSNVRSCVELSLNVPVAVNCLVAPAGILLFSGAMASETSVALVTVTDDVPEIAPDVAVTVVGPAATASPSPLLSIVMALVALEDHCTDVSTCVLPSSNMPVAVNCCCVPGAMETVAGLTEIDSMCAATTVTVEESVNVPTVAVIVAEPAATVVARPFPSTLAIVGSEVLHVTPDTRSCTDPSL